MRLYTYKSFLTEYNAVREYNFQNFVMIHEVQVQIYIKCSHFSAKLYSNCKIVDYVSSRKFFLFSGKEIK